ncbi:MAG: DUF2461 domain-containing protein [Bacteroidia bacterium]|nr:DUF2461 domain-containing protein [Bacteroidia bacterium]
MKRMQPFSGFTPETIQFLNDLKENNFREWFQDHRELYEIELLQPFRALANTLSPAMHNIDPAFEFRPHKVLSRIYRDIRFSKNKEPYRTCLWMNFQRAGTSWENFPGYFMELSTEHCLLGMGLFAPKRRVMDAFRERIESEPGMFRELVQRTVFNRGYSVEGETYKRPVPNPLPDFFRPWMNRKAVYVTKTLPLSDERIYSDALAHLIAEDFTHLSPLYRLMVEVMEETEE